MKQIIAAGLLTCLAGGLACAQSAPPPVVGVITAASQPVYAQQSYVGHIQSPQTVNIQARVTGYLESQNFTDGQAVKQGDLLYVIEPPPYQALVAQAQAALAQAQAQAHAAQLTLGRAQALLHTAAGQQSTVDLAQATYLSGEAAVQSAQAQLQTAQINLGYTQIRAPLAGIIGATTVNVGNVVGPQSGVLATIVAEDPMYVDFSLPMADALKYRARAAHMDVLLQLPDGSTYAQTGTVDFINNQVTQNTDTLAWRASIANPDHALTDGEFVTVTLRARQPQSRIVIPLAAVIADQLGDYVLEVGPGNIVKRQNVTLGPLTTTDAPVLSGVAPGDKIITEGIQSVHPGMQVNPQPAAQN
ncbi:hemolysin D [Acidocella aquatica]|uniref:Hemolysin D n=1 Tax=Acidocella aquatica TaxID=1922313 RepID=A0ABQ6AA59_9PROT|nr:efflux RND transporter periplasmic adaptor subunit [Acidocella aquatica]GLR68453.1 hemolysin D [Acidocella aquatica]